MSSVSRKGPEVAVTGAEPSASVTVSDEVWVWVTLAVKGVRTTPPNESFGVIAHRNPAVALKPLKAKFSSILPCEVNDTRRLRSEERRVGKECRSRRCAEN